MNRLSAPTKRPVRIAPVRPNVGIEFAYQKKLDALIDRMHRAIDRAIRAQWNRKPPVLASDESSPAALRQMMNALSREWSARFDEFAQQTGRRFSTDATGQADRAFAAALRKAGFTVKFTLTPAANEVLQATIAEQVALIKSIPQEYLTQVQGHVMRSVSIGRDLGQLSQSLQQQYGVTKRRAAFISRDQNNKATAAIIKTRQQELGITQAMWLHSAGGKQPRPTHIAHTGKLYDVREGWLDPAINKRIWPGTEPNCRCVSRSVIQGL